jgi:hypothetical protein
MVSRCDSLQFINGRALAMLVRPGMARHIGFVREAIGEVPHAKLVSFEVFPLDPARCRQPLENITSAYSNAGHFNC